MNPVFTFYFFLLVIVASVLLFLFRVLSDLIHRASKEIEKRKNTVDSVEKVKRDRTIELLHHLAQLTERDWRTLDTQAKFEAWCDDHGYPRTLIEKNHQSKVH